MQALLEIDCIPAGMELFPAANTEAWELIKRVIAQSDYYILIIAGVYGSQKDGISFTEMEYDYAVALGKQIIPFLHREPGAIIADKTELDAEGREKLRLFREKIENKHHCKFWISAEQLGGLVTRALVHAYKNSPEIGWVRGDRVKTVADAERVSFLQDQITQLSVERDELRTKLDHATANGNKPQRLELAQKITAVCRRFNIEWDAESTGDDRDVRSAFGVLDRAKAALLDIAQSIDDSDLAYLEFTVIDIVKRIAEMLRRELPQKGDEKFWSAGQFVASQMYTFKIQAEQIPQRDKKAR
jgi:hypothetical protein